MIGATIFFLLIAGILAIAINTKPSTPSGLPSSNTTQPDTALQCFSCEVSLEIKNSNCEFTNNCRRLNPVKLILNIIHPTKPVHHEQDFVSHGSKTNL